jgi:broad specificity phosphatase PhoE
MQGIRDIALTPRGLSDARQLGQLLQQKNLLPPRLFSSPVKRAIDTAHLLSLGVPIILEPAFRARSLGVFEGLPKREIQQRFPGQFEKLIEWDWAPPQADESLRHLFTRADTRIRELCADFPDDPLIMIVTHSGVLEAVVRGWHNLTPADPLPFPLKNAGGLLYRGHPGAWIYETTVAVGQTSFSDGA